VHFEIPASDPAKVSQFYEQLFGWKFNKMPAGDMDYWLISHKEAPENETMGGLYRKTMAETGFVNYFSVVNIDQSLAKATDLERRSSGGRKRSLTSDGSQSSRTLTTTLSRSSSQAAECRQEPQTSSTPPFFDRDEETDRNPCFWIFKRCLKTSDVPTMCRPAT